MCLVVSTHDIELNVSNLIKWFESNLVCVKNIVKFYFNNVIWHNMIYIYIYKYTERERERERKRKREKERERERERERKREREIMMHTQTHNI